LSSCKTEDRKITAANFFYYDLIILTGNIHARIVIILQEDLRLWLPGKDNQETTGKDDKSERHEKDKGDREDLDLETAHRLLRQVGDQFCDLLHQEKDALQEHMAEGRILCC